METISKKDALVIGKLTLKRARERDLPGMAQQIAFNVLFALGPLLIFTTALAGAITQQVNDNLQNPVKPVTDWLFANLPGEAAAFLREPVENALTTSPGFLLSFGAITSLWSARAAMGSLMKGLNQALGVEEERPWWKKQAIALGLTVLISLFATIGVLVFILGTGIGDDLAGAVGLGSVFSTVSVWLRWPVIAAGIVFGVMVLHYYAPDHKSPFRWTLPGAVLTVVLWGIFIIGLRIYFAVSGSFAEAYGVFGAVLAFVFWLYVMSLAILLGGVTNSAVQTRIPGARPEAEETDAPSLETDPTSGT